MIPFPVSDLKPADFARAMVKCSWSRKATAARIVALPAQWATIVAVWQSRNPVAAECRESGDVLAFARWLHCHEKDPAIIRLHRILKCRGVEPSPVATAKAERCDAGAKLAAQGVVALLNSAAWEGLRINLDPVTLFGDALAGRVDYLVLGTESERVAFGRTRLLQVVRALRPMTDVRVWLDTTSSKIRLCVRWTNTTGRHGGLTLRADLELEHELRGVSSTAVIFPGGAPVAVAVVAATAAVVEPAPMSVAAVPAVAMRRLAALRAWATRRAVAGPAPNQTNTSDRSSAAHKAWATRRARATAIAA